MSRSCHIWLRPDSLHLPLLHGLLSDEVPRGHGLFPADIENGSGDGAMGLVAEEPHLKGTYEKPFTPLRCLSERCAALISPLSMAGPIG